MLIVVKCLTGVKHDLFFDEAQQVIEIKEKLVEVTNIPIDALRLIYKGK